MIITITGNLGSGKSTVGKFLAKKFGYKHYSIGDFMSEIAEEKGLSLMQLSFEAEKSDWVDKHMDEKQIALGKEEDNFVIDSRLGWHFIPNSFKIFLKTNVDVAAKRIFNDHREDEKENVSLEATKTNIDRRVLSEKKRYKEYYGIEVKNEHFDYVLDTTNISKKEVCKTVLKKVLEHKK